MLANTSTDDLLVKVGIATPERIFHAAELLRRGVGVDRVHQACRIDPWFLDQMQQIIDAQGPSPCPSELGSHAAECATE